LQKLDIYCKLAFREKHPFPWAASVGGRRVIFYNALELNPGFDLVSIFLVWSSPAWDLLGGDF